MVPDRRRATPFIFHLHLERRGFLLISPCVLAKIQIQRNQLRAWIPRTSCSNFGPFSTFREGMFFWLISSEPDASWQRAAPRNSQMVTAYNAILFFCSTSSGPLGAEGVPPQ